MNCKYVENNVINYFEGNVSENERIRMKEHLNKCKKCRIFAKEISSIWNSVISPASTELSPYFWTKLHNRILEYEQPKTWTLFENPLRYLKPMGYGLLLCLGVFLGNKIGDSYTNKEMSANLERFEINPYLEVFSGLPEGSIGEAYINLHRDF